MDQDLRQSVPIYEWNAQRRTATRTDMFAFGNRTDSTPRNDAVMWGTEADAVREGARRAEQRGHGEIFRSVDNYSSDVVKAEICFE